MQVLQIIYAPDTDSIQSNYYLQTKYESSRAHSNKD